jgi:aarF domain-containing kinase
MIRTALKVGARSAGAALAGGIGYGFYRYQTDAGTQRMIQAYSTFVPVVLHYRWVEWRHKQSPLSDDEWQAMDELYAKPTVEKLGKLQGMYCKYGQTAAGFTNTFGDAWIQELRKLENVVPPRPVEAVHKTIEEETGKPVEHTFAYFDPKPLGSASIGQCHAARLHDGRDVAVKVQFSEAQELFKEDIHTI